MHRNVPPSWSSVLRGVLLLQLAGRWHVMSSSSSQSSASAIVAEALSGSHVLKIEGYSLTKGLGNGEFIRSEIFDIAGHRWYIRYYPDGAVSHSADSIALDNSDGKDVMAKLWISLLDHDNGQPVASHSKVDERFERYRPKGTSGFNRFIKRKDLEESGYLKDDSFRIWCRITVKNEIRTLVTESPVTRHVTVPPSNLHLHMLDLLTSGDGADVSFEVGGEIFPAHRYIVTARSLVFMAELFSPMEQKALTTIRIDGMEAKVFKAMLHFIYTDSLPKIDEEEIMQMARHLLVAADRYNLERLKLICEEILCKYISKDTAAATLTLAEQHGCEGLKQACLKFLSSLDNLKEVMATDGGVRHMRSSCPSILQVLVTNLAPLPLQLQSNKS